MNNYLYLDLFDDGIVDRNVLLDAASIKIDDHESRALNVAKFQTLLCMLFDRRIIVPEAWVTSSPLFARLFVEIFDALPTEVQKEDNLGSQPITAVNPFVFSFIKPTNDNAAITYLEALESRLRREDGRIEWLPKIDPAKAYWEAQQQLADIISEFLISSPEFNGYELDKLEGDLERVLLGAFELEPADGGQNLAKAVRKITEYLSHPKATQEARKAWWGNQGHLSHAASIQKAIKNVFAAIAEDKSLRELHTTQVNQFGSFVEEVQQKNIAPSNVMAMWPLLKNYDQDIRIAAEMFGRYSLNSGFSDSLNSSQNALSFNYYSSAPKGDFINDLLKSVLSGSGHAAEFEVPNGQFLDVAPVGEYDLIDTVDWKNAWEAAAKLSYSNVWSEEKIKLATRIEELGVVQESCLDEWNAVFDMVNGRFQDLSFEIGGATSDVGPYVRIVKKNLEKNKLGNVSSLVSSAMQLNGATAALYQLVMQHRNKLRAETAMKKVRNVYEIKDYNVLLTRPISFD